MRISAAIRSCVSGYALVLLSATVGAAAADELAVVGTGDGIEMLRAVASAYNAEHRETVVTIPPSIGSGGAVAAVGGDRQKLGRVARPLTGAEQAQGLVETPLARIPSAIFAHRGTNVAGLTSAQIAGLFSGAVENWNEVGGPDLKVRVVRREETDSTLSILRASMPGWRNLVLTARSKMATTTQDAVDTVTSTPGAIGFGPFSPALAGEIVVLSVDGRGPRDPDYPSAVTLALIHKPATLDDAARDFLGFAHSDKAKRLLAEGGGVPLGP